MSRTELPKFGDDAWVSMCAKLDSARNSNSKKPSGIEGLLESWLAPLPYSEAKGLDFSLRALTCFLVSLIALAVLGIAGAQRLKPKRVEGAALSQYGHHRNCRALSELAYLPFFLFKS